MTRAGSETPREHVAPFALDDEALLSEYPAAGEYEATLWRASSDEVHGLQERRLLAIVDRAWDFDFYRRLWSAAGAEPGDVRSTEDVTRLPTFDVHDLRADLDDHPPFGTHQEGIGPHTSITRMITSGGTTGVPRPILLSTRDREISTIVGSRALHIHGLRPGMLVQIVNSLSTVLGGIYLLECLAKYIRAVPLTTGGGNTTGTEMQVQMAAAYGTSAIAGFPDYIRHIGTKAIEAGLDPRTDLGIRIISSPLGTRDRTPIEDLFGARLFDMYGTSEVGGFVSTECQAQDGLHVMEDAHLVELLERDTDRPVAADEVGNVVVTCLFKTSAPIIRYNTHDLARRLPSGCSCGSAMAKHGPIEGRTDDLVKVKGTWVHPDAIGRIVDREPRSNSEYVCVYDADAAPGADAMRVLVEVADARIDRDETAHDLAVQIKQELGLKLPVECVDVDSLDRLTGRSTSRTGKPRRLVHPASLPPST